jgi:hypothetical protein
MRFVTPRIIGVSAFSLCGLVCPGAHSGRANTGRTRATAAAT